MKAAFYERTGPAAEVLQVGQMPDPQPGPGEVRVRLRWSGVNPSDVKARAGLRSTEMPCPRIVPHSDGMGIVDAVGDDVPVDRVGQRVWIWNGAWGRPFGTAATFIVLPQSQAVPMPGGVPDEAGACLGIPALTALHAMLTAGGVAGKRVLVSGGAGAVGHYAVQFARLLGARQVLATISTPAKAAIARSAGADVAVDYRQPDAAARLREATEGEGLDRIVELDIAANAALDVESLRPGGAVVAYGSGAGEFSLPFYPLILRNLNLHFFIVYNLPPADRQHAVNTLTAFLARGSLQHAIAERLPLDNIAQAHDLVASGDAVGNVLLSLP